MEWIEILLVASTIIFILKHYMNKYRDYWKSRGIKHSSLLDFLKDIIYPIFPTKDPLKYQIDVYNRYKNERCFAVAMLRSPSFLVRDPDLLKLIMVKDCNFFLNRADWNNDSDSFISKSLSLLQGEKWRNLRTVMTTVFTGAKMKDMSTFMEKCAEQANDYIALKIEKQINDKGSNVFELDIKDFFSRLGTDIIASTAFGLEVDSFKNPNNEFYSVGMKMTRSFSSFPAVKWIFMTTFPGISKTLGMSLFDKKVTEFFVSIVNETIQNREKYNIVRKDLIHILVEARKGIDQNGEAEFTRGKLPNLTNEDIAAQAWLFFFGGFDFLATTLSFACFELAMNPELQEKLYEDIKQVSERDNKIGYNQIMYDMHYLDMVVKECFRKWPLAQFSDREVTETYVVPASENGQELTFKEGDVITIPIVGLHRDPNYFTNPEKFDPERFRDEKNTVKPFTYLPFGAGIRHCIAMRYALMQIKLCLAFLLMKFEVVTTPKTDLTLKLNKKAGFMLRPEKGFWMGLKPRV